MTKNSEIALPHKKVTRDRLKHNYYQKKWRLENIEKVKEISKKYHVKNPWMKHYSTAKKRCSNVNNIKYKSYGGKGIKFLLTKEGIKHIWFRDFAWKLNRPSIDRINSKENYCLSNCRFIELSENSRLGGMSK